MEVAQILNAFNHSHSEVNGIAILGRLVGGLCSQKSHLE